jgi:Trk K+ transport system NAD-binding subunit
MDVAIIVLFAVMTSLASPLLTGEALDLSFLGLLALDLGSALVIGLTAGRVLAGLLATRLSPAVKALAILAVGFGVYELADWVKAFTRDAFGFEVYIEPLLISLIAGFFVTNYTRFRDEFDDILHRISPGVYVAFFTITGLSLKLDLLASVLPVALILFVVRALGIAAGSNVGGRFAGEPPRFTRISWMAFITQAGIALGLAREVAVQFPALGDSFATLVISVVVVNEVLGPLFLKSGLRRAGEAHEPGAAPDPGARGAVILGVEGQSIALARALIGQGWRVVVADTDAAQVERLAASDLDERHIDSVDDASLDSLIDDNTQAVVAMLGDDSDNLAALRFALERHGIGRLIARPASNERLAEFEELGAFLVDPSSAVVAVLAQAVDAPQSVALFMHRDPDRVIAQIPVSNSELDGVPVRDLRLPTDVLLLEMLRGVSSVVVSGHTSLHVGDQLTIVGAPDSLDLVRLQLTA